MNPEELAAALRRLVGSSFADSLRSLAGTPSATVLQKRRGNALGEYVLPTNFDPAKALPDTVYLTPALFRGQPVGRPPADDLSYRNQPEYALAHEMGHRRQAVRQLAGQFAMTDALRAKEDSAAASGQRGPKAYWQQNNQEHYAEAFANAVTFLRRTAAQRAGVDLPRQTEPLLAQADSTVPGTRMMVQQLLGDSLYSNHPLNQSRVASQQLNKGVTNLLSPVSSVVPNP